MSDEKREVPQTDSHRETALEVAERWLKNHYERDRLASLQGEMAKVSGCKRHEVELQTARMQAISRMAREEEVLKATIIALPPIHVIRNNDLKPVLVYCKGKTYRCVETE